MPATTQIDDLAGLVRDGGRWRLTVTPRIANGSGAIYGGAALGASIDVALVETGMACRWASTRFLAAPKVGQTLEISFTADAVGRRTSHATVRSFIEGVPQFETMIVVGAGDQGPRSVTGQWTAIPDVPSPSDCAPMNLGPRADRYAMGRIERRIASGPHPWHDPNSRGSGRLATWVKMSGGGASTPAGLAWLSDIVATAFAQSVGPLSRATSLDNTIRFARTGKDSEWILTDVIAEAAEDGYAYGRVDCYAEDGTLLATATQTCICRRSIDEGLLA